MNEGDYWYELARFSHLDRSSSRFSLECEAHSPFTAYVIDLHLKKLTNALEDDKAPPNSFADRQSTMKEAAQPPLVVG